MEDDTASRPCGSPLTEVLGPLVISPCLACPTPGRCTDADNCTTPKKGEVWHILRAGALACDTVTIAEMTPRTVVFEPKGYGLGCERVPLGMGLRFIERACGPNAQVQASGAGLCAASPGTES